MGATMLENTLKEREHVYGDYRGDVETKMKIMDAILNRYYEVNGQAMPAKHMEYIHPIVMKLVRIAASPTHTDSWHDIAGYATLTESILIEDTQPKLPGFEEDNYVNERRT